MFLRPDAEDDDGGREGLPEEEQQDAQPRGDNRRHGVLGREEPVEGREEGDDEEDEGEGDHDPGLD